MILVTGATGNVGGAVLAQLRVEGHAVRLGVRRPAAVQIGGIQTTVFDITKRDTFGPALRGIERIFLMRPPAVADVRHSLFPFIDAARAAGVRQVVFLSLLGAEGKAFLPHTKVENYLKAAGMEYTLLRAGFFMQNLATAHRQEIRQQDEIVVPAGNGKTSFIDVADIAAVAALALTRTGHANRAYDLTGAEALDYATVAALMSLALGRPIAYRHPSLGRFLRHQRALGTGVAQSLLVAAIYTTTRLGMAGRITGDVARLLGRPPRSLRAYIEENRQVWVK